MCGGIREGQPWFQGSHIVLLHSGEELRMSRYQRAAVERLLGKGLGGGVPHSSGWTSSRLMLPFFLFWGNESGNPGQLGRREFRRLGVFDGVRQVQQKTMTRLNDCSLLVAVRVRHNIKSGW
jgi:hypothetical protein